MLDIIKEIVMFLILAGVCAIGAELLRSQKRQIIATVADLIQKAEQAVQGSGMGNEKKKLVIAQLEAMGVKVTEWISTQIDNIVTQLNERGAWYATTAGSTITNTVK